jgi:CheY-like chemotaxis protein
MATDMLVVEDNRTECGLACMAIALRRPGTRLRESRDVADALAIVAQERPRLALLGWSALRDRPERLAKDLIVVGFAARLSDADKGRALAAGVRAVYDRPSEWELYCDTVETILNEWLDKKSA